jgi:hypothetical protein
VTLQMKGYMNELRGLHRGMWSRINIGGSVMAGLQISIRDNTSARWVFSHVGTYEYQCPKDSGHFPTLNRSTNIFSGR